MKETNTYEIKVNVPEGYMPHADGIRLPKHGELFVDANGNVQKAEFAFINESYLILVPTPKQGDIVEVNDDGEQLRPPRAFIEMRGSRFLTMVDEVANSSTYQLAWDCARPCEPNAEDTVKACVIPKGVDWRAVEDCTITHAEIYGSTLSKSDIRHPNNREALQQHIDSLRELGELPPKELVVGGTFISGMTMPPKEVEKPEASLLIGTASYHSCEKLEVNQGFRENPHPTTCAACNKTEGVCECVRLEPYTEIGFRLDWSRGYPTYSINTHSKPRTNTKGLTVDNVAYSFAHFLDCDGNTNDIASEYVDKKNWFYATKIIFRRTEKFGGES